MRSRVMDRTSVRSGVGKVGSIEVKGVVGVSSGPRDLLGSRLVRCPLGPASCPNDDEGDSHDSHGKYSGYHKRLG